MPPNKPLTCDDIENERPKNQRPPEKHGHTGIGLNTPADVHYGLAASKGLERAKTLAAARARTPERFTTNNDPKILAIPGTAWINKPAEKNDTKAAA